MYRTQRGRAACAIIEVDQYPGEANCRMMQAAVVGEVYIVPQIAAELPAPATEAGGGTESRPMNYANVWLFL